jgi:hypothetical protein
MKLNDFFLAAAVLLAGCMAKTGNPVLKGSESGINRQMEPLRTKSAVRGNFGTPDLVFQKEGLETYEYRRIDGNGRYHWMIPVFGWFMAMFQDRFAYEETNLFVRFDSKDNVEDWRVIQTGGTTE